MSYMNKIDDIVRNKKEMLIQFISEIAFDDEIFFEQFSHMLLIQSINQFKKNLRVLIFILLKVLILYVLTLFSIRILSYV